MSRVPGEQITKDPQSIEPEGFDWTAYLAELGAGITISTSSWAVSPSVSPPSLTLSGSGILAGNLKTVVTLNGGTAGERYTVTNHATFSNGGADDRSFLVLVEER